MIRPGFAEKTPEDRRTSPSTAAASTNRSQDAKSSPRSSHSPEFASRMGPKPPTQALGTGARPSSMIRRNCSTVSRSFAPLPAASHQTSPAASVSLAVRGAEREAECARVWSRAIASLGPCGDNNPSESRTTPDTPGCIRADCFRTCGQLAAGRPCPGRLARSKLVYSCSGPENICCVAPFSTILPSFKTQR